MAPEDEAVSSTGCAVAVAEAVGDGEALLLPLRLGEAVKGETLPLAVAVVDSVADGVAEASAVMLADSDTLGNTLGVAVSNADAVVEPVIDGETVTTAVALADGVMLGDTLGVAVAAADSVVDAVADGVGELVCDGGAQERRTMLPAPPEGSGPLLPLCATGAPAPASAALPSQAKPASELLMKLDPPPPPLPPMGLPVAVSRKVLT